MFDTMNLMGAENARKLTIFIAKLVGFADFPFERKLVLME